MQNKRLVKCKADSKTKQSSSLTAILTSYFCLLFMKKASKEGPSNTDKYKNSLCTCVLIQIYCKVTWCKNQAK